MVTARKTLRLSTTVTTGLAVIAALMAPITTGRVHAADTLPAETVQARQHFFGKGNVDPASGKPARDRAVFSWVTTSTLAASIAGRVVLLDTYIHKGEDQPNYVPATVGDLIALRPEAIFIGHGHSDHAKNAGTIAVETGATIVGTPEHCDQAKAEASEYAPTAPQITCVAAVSRDSAAGAEVNVLSMLAPAVCVTALKHLHSDAEPPDPEHAPNPVLAVPDVGPVLVHPPGPSAVVDVADTFADTGDEGWSVLYQFRVGAFAVTWHDTVGPLKERAPQVLELLRGLPRTDVQLGAVLGLNVATNGLRDPAMYVEALRSKVFAPLHHDFITEYGSADDYESAFRREPEVRTVAPEIRWLSDPRDYVRPELLEFDVKDPRWSGNERPSRGCA